MIDEEKLEQALKHMEHGDSQPLAANKVGMSSSGLYKACATKYGKAPGKIIRERRDSGTTPPNVVVHEPEFKTARKYVKQSAGKDSARCIVIVATASNLKELLRELV